MSAITAKELREIIQPINDENGIVINLVKGNQVIAMLHIVGYERSNIGDEEDDLFVLKLEINDECESFIKIEE